MRLKLKSKIVFAGDIDPHVKDAYFANYNINQEDWHDDVAEFSAKKYKGKVDLLVGGSPCQSFSMAGRRGGLDDTRGTLFHDFIRVVQESNPKIFIFENVKGVINHDGGNTWGVIKTKLRFGQEAGDADISIPGTPVIRKPLAEGILGEANMDGSIYVNETINPNSEEYKQVVNHEMRHSTDMKIGKLAYTDNDVTYNGEVFPRMDVNGVDSILVDGKWKEAGSHDFPWENDANNGTI